MQCTGFKSCIYFLYLKAKDLAMGGCCDATCPLPYLIQFCSKTPFTPLCASSSPILFVVIFFSVPFLLLFYSLPYLIQFCFKTSFTSLCVSSSPVLFVVIFFFLCPLFFSSIEMSLCLLMVLPLLHGHLFS